MKRRKMVVGAMACVALGCGVGSGATGGRGGLASDDQAAIDGLNAAEPMQVTLAELQAEYSAYSVEGTIEQNVTDPSTVSDAMLDQMVDDDAPGAEASALQWVQGLDLSTVPQWAPDPNRQAACVEQFGCNY